MPAPLPPSSIDLKRLTRDAKRGHIDKGAAKGPSAFALVRTALPTIRALRADGIPWAEIATALGLQGVTEGSGEAVKPITRSRLTAIVTQIEQADLMKANKSAARLERTDLVRQRQKPPRRAAVVLAPELAVKRQDATPDAGELDDEEAIRRKALDTLRRDFLKPDPEG